jgi:DNA replication protein DnaC
MSTFTLAQATAAALRNPATTLLSPTSKSASAPPWRPHLDEHHPSLVRAADLAARWIADLARGSPPYWLTFAGEPGVGKTLLARQTWLEARRYQPAATSAWPAQTGLYDERRRRPACRWLDAADFARLYLDDRQYDLPEYLAHEWLVGFDDLGAKSDAKDLLADALYRLAQRRLGKWTLWTTNLTLDEIARRIDARVSSRLIRDTNRLVTITAPDYSLLPK